MILDTYTISKEESERINCMKFIAIVFVVYIHSYAVDVNFADGTKTLYLPKWLLLFEELISQTISRCGVPLFFLISSILLFKKQRNYTETIKGKIKTHLLPYVIWNSIWILVFILLQELRCTAPYFSGHHTPILQCSFSEWLNLYGIGWNLPHPQDYPLWFMRDLMIVTLIFPIIEKVADRVPKLLFIGVTILLLLPVDFPLKQALLWFSLGAVIVKLQIHITLVDKYSMLKLSLAYMLGALISLFAESSAINVLFIFFGIIYWTRVTKCIFDFPKCKAVFLRMSKWTFIIYVAHEMTLSSLKKICFKLMPTEPAWLLLEYILLPITVIMGCSILGAAFKKIAPKAYAISTGER